MENENLSIHDADLKVSWPGVFWPGVFYHKNHDGKNFISWPGVSIVS